MSLLYHLNSRLGRNASVKLASELVARAASFGLVLLAARLLGEADFGRYNYGLALGFVVAQLADFGLQMLLSREIAVLGREARPLVRAALQLKVILSLPVLLLLWLLTAGSDGAVRLALLLLGLMMLAQTYLEFVAYIFRGQQQLQVEAFLLAAARLLMALLGALVLLSGGGLAGLALSNLLAAGLVALWALRLLGRKGWIDGAGSLLRVAPPRFYGGLLRQAFPLGLAIFLSIAYTRTAILLLQARQGELAVATFSAAHRLVEPWQIIPASLLAAVFPAFSQALHHDPAGARRLGRRITLLLAGLGAGLAFALWIAAPWLIPLLYGGEYAASAPVLRLLGLSAVLTFVNYSLTHYLIARRQQAVIGLFTGGMLLLHAALCWLLIPRWGALAPAASIIVAETLLFLCCTLTLIFTRAQIAYDSPTDPLDADPAGAAPSL